MLKRIEWSPPILEPSQKGQKTSSPRAVSLLGWTRKALERPGLSFSFRLGDNLFSAIELRCLAHPGHEEHILLLPCAAEQDYHPVYAIQLDVNRPAYGTLPHRSHYHPNCTGCDGGWPNRMGALPPRFSPNSRRLRVDGMDLDSHGLCHLWHGGIGIRPCHSHEHSGWTRRNRHSVSLQCDERGREFFIDPIRRPRVFAFVPGDRASIIPPSQSSVPFFIRKTLIRSNPASVNQVFVSAAL